MGIIATSTDTIRSVETWRVDTASKLTDDSWTEQPSLLVNRLSTVAGPDIDTAELEFNYGLYADGQNVSPLSLERSYVRIMLRDTDSEPDDPTVTQMKDNAFLVWYGIIEVDERDTDGTRVIDSLDVPTGDQKFTAFGLLRELETTIVNESVVENSTRTFQTIKRGIPFNLQSTSQYPDRGNQSGSRSGPSGNTYIFSFEPFADSASDLWSALTALEYTLEYDVPKDGNGDRAYPWQLDGTFGALSWYDISVQRDQRSVKDIIDDLLDRRRLIGYYVKGVEDSSGFHAELHYFTFNENVLVLDFGVFINQNPRQFTLDFESSFDVDIAILSNNTAHRTDRVTVRGAFITTTFSCWIASNFLEEGWTSTEETEFKDAAKDITGYAGLTTDEKQKANQIARTQESLNDVFAKFVIGDAWDLVVPAGIDGGGNAFFIAVETLPIIGLADITLDFATTGAIAAKLWHKGQTFLRYIPIREQSDDDLSDYKDPFVVFRTTDAATDIWEFGHQLAAKSVWQDADSRQFSTRLVLLDKELGFRVEVGASGGQQLIALVDWASSETTKEEYDPTTSEGNGVDFKDMIVTVAIEWDDRIEVTADSPDPDSAILMQGRQLREMIIEIPDARLDFLLPETVTDIDDAGALVTNTIGSTIRDDRERIANIAIVAAEWFGRKRQAVQLRYKQVRPPTDGIDTLLIGDLITSIGSIYSDPDVNSVVTSIIYETGDSPTTTVETSYAHLDLSDAL